MATRQEARNKRRDARNAKAPKGKHWCYMHNNGEGAYLLYKMFHKNKNKVHGLNDRCRKCANEYRIAYEAVHGRRADQTKTLRVTPRTHALTKEKVAERELTIPQYLSAAIGFYEMYGCRRGRCTNRAVRWNLCRDHLEEQFEQVRSAS